MNNEFKDHGFIDFFYYKPYWAIIIYGITIINILMIVSGDIVKGIVLQLFHVPWAISLYRLKGWRYWFWFGYDGD